MPKETEREAIGGYEVAEEIGRGGAAVVYRAHQPQLERWVAIKVLEVDETGEEEFLTRFRREAKAIAALRHPNILTVYDYGEEEGTAYIVMEYVSGGTLKSLLDGEPMEWPRVASLIIPVGSALEYAHSEGIVHRDVKPANILMARPDWPLLADFGLAKLLSTRRGITEPGTSLGTPTYISPEQAAGESVDHRSDIYSLGLLLYELLTGEIPFRSESPLQCVLLRLHEPPPPVCSVNPDVSPELEGVVMRALKRDPSARYPTMRALVEDLRRLLDSSRASVEEGEQGESSSITMRLMEQQSFAGPKLIVATSGTALRIPAKDEILIGRADPNIQSKPDVDLDTYGGVSAGVSRRHARLLRRPDGWFLEDLHSTNGTFLNDVRLPPGQPVRVHGDDRIVLGALALIFTKE